MVVVMFMVTKKTTLKSKKGKMKVNKILKKSHPKKPLKKPKLKRAVKKAVRKVVRKKAKVKKLIKSKKVVKTTVKKAVKAKPKPIEKKPDLELIKRGANEQRKLMRGVVKILSDSCVRQNLIEVGGENALAIVRNFYGNCSDEELAKKLKLKISDVRATLNKLHNEGLVNYIREKDSETGWYSYSWSLNHMRMEKWASSQALNLNPHDAEGVDYYFCPSCGTSSIINFESATDIEFRCESCNRMLEFIDEKKMLQLYERI